MRYETFLAEHAWLEVAMCWTVVEPVTVPVDVAEVVRRLGGDPRDLRPRGLDTGYDVGPHERLYYLDQAGPAVTMLEVNGYEGRRPEVLRQLSDGARVHSAYWNVNSVNQLSYAVYGTLVTALDGAFPEDRYGSDPDALDDDFPFPARDEDDDEDWPWRPAMLACIEARTGVALDGDWTRRDHPAIVLPPLPEDPRPPNPGIEADLDASLRLATDADRRAALAWLLDQTVDAFDLRAEPALPAAFAAFRAGRQLDEPGQAAVYAVRDRLWLHWERHPSGDDMERDPGWRRAQAGWALGAALCADSWQDPLESLQHLRLAFGDRWPGLAKDLKAYLRSAAGSPVTAVRGR
ncbi:DUF6461 domain-containing protein [Dactylosporangium siamense]|uniref:Uncharacterized protein n=1 Tax=Dactylosporangium siamense TaxID=685454 RepID=A0A919PL37_9ACTN|nr:DUF6461 domain-containing protein [Dactylosporangium siamense]GIG45542.1 hypothetical protein Dsi01nite_035830 [Dactylosporangium siamense]